MKLAKIILSMLLLFLSTPQEVRAEKECDWNDPDCIYRITFIVPLASWHDKAGDYQTASKTKVENITAEMNAWLQGQGICTVIKSKVKWFIIQDASELINSGLTVNAEGGLDLIGSQAIQQFMESGLFNKGYPVSGTGEMLLGDSSGYGMMQFGAEQMVADGEFVTIAFDKVDSTEAVGSSKGFTMPVSSAKIFSGEDYFDLATISGVPLSNDDSANTVLHEVGPTGHADLFKTGLTKLGCDFPDLAFDHHRHSPPDGEDIAHGRFNGGSLEPENFMNPGRTRDLATNSMNSKQKTLAADCFNGEEKEEQSDGRPSDLVDAGSGGTEGGGGKTLCTRTGWNYITVGTPDGGKVQLRLPKCNNGKCSNPKKCKPKSFRDCGCRK